MAVRAKLKEMQKALAEKGNIAIASAWCTTSEYFCKHIERWPDADVLERRNSTSVHSEVEAVDPKD